VDRAPKLYISNTEIGEEIDYSGFEVTRFTRDLLKTNPTLIEITSEKPVWYLQNKFEILERIINICLLFINLKALAKHYLGMTLTFCKNFSKGQNQKSHHIIRCLYNTLYIVFFKEKPLIQSIKTVEAIHSASNKELPSWLNKETSLAELLRRKRITIDKCNAIREFLLENLKERIDKLDIKIARPNESIIRELNKLIHQLHV